MIVRVEDEQGVFAAIFSIEKEKEARKLFQRMVKDACRRVAVVELLDSELHTIKLKHHLQQHPNPYHIEVFLC